MFPLVSVIIVNNNTEVEFIGKCFSSLSKLTFAEKMEIIVVDNASEDNSLDYIIHTYGSFLNIKIIRSNKNSGYGAGNNNRLKIC